MNQPKRKLKINLIDLESAFEHQGDPVEISYFLDLETGEVVMITGEERDLLEEINEKYADAETHEVDWDRILPELDIPDWQKETLPGAAQVEADYGTRYTAIPQDESYEGYNDMAAFIETLSKPHLQSQLEQAIHGKGAFRNFKNVLLAHPEERERWFQFRDERLHQRIFDWLEAEGIEII
jgi:hypothetical protein